MSEYRSPCDFDFIQEPLLELKSVAFAYSEQNGAKLALEDISLKVHRGERIIILGHNGSGKSTLARIMGALQNPRQGTCFLFGRDIREIPFRELHQLIGLVFQDPESQIVGAVVADDVAFAPENQGVATPEIQRRVDWALERVGLAYKKNSVVSALSGGEKQRLAIAGALAANVKCLILDEPTAMLDPEGRLEIEQVLHDIHASGTALVQVTHQLEFDSQDVDRIFVLSSGRILWQGTPSQFWPRAESLGFDLPPLYRMGHKLGLNNIINVETVASAIKNNAITKTTATVPVSDETPQAFIQVQDLSFHFDVQDAVTTLDRVCVDIPSGQWLSIIGRTGSGKSTLVQHLNGLYKIQSGKIMIKSAMPLQSLELLPQKGRELHKLRRRVGLVFQSPEDQFFCPTVREELAFAPSNAGLAGDDLNQAVLSAIDAIGLSREFLERNPMELSGGEQRLVAIASVLSAGPECLVLDEPTAGLDAAFRKHLLKLLASFCDNGGTVVSITHDLNMALDCSDKILVMKDGQSLAEGTAREILPALMQTLKPEVWPEALQISTRLGLSPESLIWNPEELLSTYGVL